MKALVMAGGLPQIELINQLKERGIFTVLADGSAAPLAKPYADKTVQINIFDVEAIKELAVREQVDFLITCCADQALLIVAQVSELLGLPCYISYKTAQDVSDKRYMKRIFWEHGIPTSRYVEMEELDPNNLERYFISVKIEEGDAVYERINGKSYVENDDIGLNDLRYMKVLHYNFDHEIQIGELIVNEALVKDYQEIFLELFENEYEIYSMYLIDNFWTGRALSSDSASIDANNTSAFCYRRSASSSNLSNHALGRAIDINPQQNPYVTFDEEGDPVWTHDNADDYINRSKDLPHMINHDDLAFKLFEEHGFEWGGDWHSLKDYQHFEKEK